MRRTGSIVALSLLVAAVACAQDATGKPKDGWEAIDKGLYQTAEGMFRTALKANANDADAHAGLGVAYSRQTLYTLAEIELTQAKELGSTYEHLDFELGKALYLQDNFEGARKSLKAYAKSHPDSWTTHEMLGLLHYNMREFDDCIEELSHPSLAAHSEHASLVLYHLGMCKVAEGDVAAGRADLDRCSTEHEKTIYGRASKDALAALASQPAESAERDIWARNRRQRPDRWWFVGAGVGGGFDTNPLSIGEEALLEGSLARRDTWFLNTRASVGARILNRPDTLWAVEFSHFANWHDELSKFDQNLSSLSTYAEHWLCHWIGVTASASISTLDVGPNEVRDSWSAGCGVYAVEANWTRTRLSYDHVDNEYFLDLNDFTDLDGEFDTVGVSQEAFIPGTDLRVALGYAYTNASAEGSDNDADIHRVSFSASHPIVWEIVGTAGVSFSEADYDHDNSRDPQVTERHDDALAASVRLDRRVTDWMGVYVSAVFVDNESHTALFDYDRNLYTAGFEIRY